MFNKQEKSQESILQFSQAFYDLIIDLFLNYQNHVAIVDNESVFDYKGFLDDSDAEYKEFFYRFLQIEDGKQSNNQMFSNFITVTTARVVDDVPEDEIVMTEHVKQSIKRVHNGYTAQKEVKAVSRLNKSSRATSFLFQK